MYYNKNEVNNILNCKNCLERLDEPRILPCGEIICSFCTSSLKIVDKIFDCSACKEKHEIPKSGLPICKPLLEMLSIKPTKVSRGKAFNTLQESFSHIRTNINLIKHGLNNRDEFIKEHCIELRNEVQLVAEEAFEQINDIIILNIKEIDEYEKEQLKSSQDMENINLSKSLLNDLNNCLKEMESFYDANIQSLNKNQLRDSLIVKLNENAIDMRNKAEYNIKNLQRINLGGKIMKLDYNEQENLCSMKIIHLDERIDSSILIGKDQIKNLIALCVLPDFQKWNLIYRASQDGFEAVSFHAKCDSKPNTLVIIQSTNGNIFGGYTEQTWNHTGAHKVDPNSYIFSLINKLNKPIKIKWTQNHGICCNNANGPTFGAYDLNIADNANINTTSYSNLSHSYVHPFYANGSNEAKSFLAGSYNFQVSEIEVYTKQ